jgi:LacI family transcriptional regulator
MRVVLRRANAGRRVCYVTTVNDVAAHAGVSPMTVSRVLSGSPNVRAETRDRVERSIYALNYRRNEIARTLRQGHRAAVIGIVVTNLSNPYYAKVIEGIEQVAAESGRRLLIAASHEKPEIEQELIDDFLSRQVEGLVVVPVLEDAVYLRPEYLGSVPLVLASRAAGGIDADSVLVDDFGGSFAATEVLLQEGHRRIAFIGNNASVFTARRRFAGYAAAMVEHGVVVDESLVGNGSPDAGSARDEMGQMLRMRRPPTAAFAVNAVSTVGILQALHPHPGGDKFRIAGFDDFELSDLMPNRITVVDHDAHELGRLAATFLLERLAATHPSGTRRLVNLPTRLFSRGGYRTAHDGREL